MQGREPAAIPEEAARVSRRLTLRGRRGHAFGRWALALTLLCRKLGTRVPRLPPIPNGRGEDGAEAGAWPSGRLSGGPGLLCSAGPLRIVVLLVTVGLTWILVSSLLGAPGPALPRLQQLFSSESGPFAQSQPKGSPSPGPGVGVVWLVRAPRMSLGSHR